jgi:hypothetical protein
VAELHTFVYIFEISETCFQFFGFFLSNPMRLSDANDVLLLPTMMWSQLLTVVEISGESGKVENHNKLVSWQGVKYLVGAHVAEFLGRETFNLYESLKRRNIALWPVDYELLSFLRTRGCIFTGCTSANTPESR